MIISKQELTKASKFLSFVLRHKPDSIEIILDKQGWTNISELIDKAKPQIILSIPLIQQVVASNDKKRFALSDDKLRIRANQGHSIKVDLELTAKEPPAILYHGTATRFLDSINQQGLKAGKRHYVHLSTNINTATAVGKRYGKPVILEIDAGAMHQEGHEFFLSENEVWLTQSVPKNYLITAR